VIGGRKRKGPQIDTDETQITEEPDPKIICVNLCSSVANSAVRKHD